MDVEVASAALAEPPGSDQRGFSVLEVVAGTVISVLAIVGLAYSFGLGRGLLDRHGVARAALGTAQRRMEILSTRPASALVPGSDSTRVFYFSGVAVGVEHWSVEWVDEPADSLGASDLDGDPNDVKRVTLRVLWGSGLDADTIRLVRTFPAG
jgi:hypothetical protein